MGKPAFTDSFMMGTENGPDGPKKTVRFALYLDGWTSIILTSNDQIQALNTWVQEAQQLMADIAQQSHAWVTPSTEPGLFENLQEELDELRHAGSLK